MDLTTSYMGLPLKNPFVASASPLSESVDTIRRLEDHGASAVVMFSLFEEQIRHDRDAMEYFLGLGYLRASARRSHTFPRSRSTTSGRRNTSS